MATAPSITSLGRDISAVGQRLGLGECRNASEARGHHFLEGLMGGVVKIPTSRHSGPPLLVNNSVNSDSTSQ